MRRWGAVWILALLFLGSWLGQLIAQVKEVADNAHDHGEKFLWSDFWPQFFTSTFENWQSEFLQLAVQAVLIASLVGQKKFFNADGGADKEDVERILRAIGSQNGDEQKHRA
jgi:hypothetical protein